MSNIKITTEEKVTNKIIEIIQNNQTEKGIDWSKLPLTVHYNSVSNTYNFLNSLILSDELDKQQYKNSQWLTYNQTVKLGGQVAKGEKSTLIILTFPVFEKDKNGEYVLNKKGEKAISTFRSSGVNLFNIEQTSLKPNSKFNVETLKDLKKPLELDLMTERFINDFPVSIAFNGGDMAFYSPGLNSIHIPNKDKFVSNEALLSVVFHEASHSTGHRDWLNREGITDTNANFGSEKYAFEELVAELSAAMLCSKYKVNYKIQYHASYIDSWLSVLKSDKKAIFKASAQATKSCNEISKYVYSYAAEKKVA